jgi:hypothetical protein
LRLRHADVYGKSYTASNQASQKKKMNASIQLRAFGYGTIFMVVALLVFSPWMIRNYIWTNNPIYPLYDKWFNPPIESSSTTSEAGQKTFLKKTSVPLSHFSIRRINYGESGWEIALVPVRVFFQGKDGDPQYFDGKLSPFLLLLPIFAFYRKGANNSLLMTEKKALFAFSILLLLFVYFQNQMRIRWIAPIIPPLIILSMFGLKEIGTIFTARDSAKSGKISASITGVIILAAIIMNAVYVLEQFKHVNPFEYISGRVERDDYIERYRDEYPTLKYANRTLPQEARILSLFLGNRYYYSDREMIFDELIFRNAVVGAKSVQDISFNLRKKGITHLLVRYDLFVDWSEVNFSGRQKNLIKLFFKEHIELLYSKNGYGLYNL